MSENLQELIIVSPADKEGKNESHELMGFINSMRGLDEFKVKIVQSSKGHINLVRDIREFEEYPNIVVIDSERLPPKLKKSLETIPQVIIDKPMSEVVSILLSRTRNPA